jgi:hypothetical protein
MITAYLLNLNTAVNYDNFQITDNIAGAVVARFTLQGGARQAFTCQDNGGTGDVTVVNTDNSVSLHFGFVADGDVLKM